MDQQQTSPSGRILLLSMISSYSVSLTLSWILDISSSRILTLYCWMLARSIDYSANASAFLAWNLDLYICDLFSFFFVGLQQKLFIPWLVWLSLSYLRGSLVSINCISQTIGVSLGVYSQLAWLFGNLVVESDLSDRLIDSKWVSAQLYDMNCPLLSNYTYSLRELEQEGLLSSCTILRRTTPNCIIAILLIILPCSEQILLKLCLLEDCSLNLPVSVRTILPSMSMRSVSSLMLRSQVSPIFRYSCRASRVQQLIIISSPSSKGYPNELRWSCSQARDLAGWRKSMFITPMSLQYP